MKRILLSLIMVLLLLAGCLPGAPDVDNQHEVVEEGKDEDEKVVISRDIRTTDRYYRSVLPYAASDTRGFILSGVANRLDIDEFETGLIRLSQDVFDPEDYYLRDGEILKEKDIQAWITRRSKNNEKGLNPALGVNESASVKEKMEANKKNPNYLSFVLEQNYMIEKGKDNIELGGISIGVSLNSIFYFSIMDDNDKIHSGEVDLTKQKKKVIEEGKKMAQQIINEIRTQKDGQDVPIMVALYTEEARESLIPGHFVSVASVGKGKTSIGSWEDLDEQHYLFPSPEVTKDHRSDAEKFNNFKSKIEDFFPNFTGVIGKGFYKDGELQKMSVEIPMQFHGKSELIAFAQYVTDLVASQLFSDETPFEVNITSMDKQEAVIVKTPGQKEPFVHIYR